MNELKEKINDLKNKDINNKLKIEWLEDGRIQYEGGVWDDSWGGYEFPCTQVGEPTEEVYEYLNKKYQDEYAEIERIKTVFSTMIEHGWKITHLGLDEYYHVFPLKKVEIILSDKSTYNFNLCENAWIMSNLIHKARHEENTEAKEKLEALVKDLRKRLNYN